MSGLDNLLEVAAALAGIPDTIRAATPEGKHLGRSVLLYAASVIEKTAPELSAAADRIEREAYTYWWRYLEKRYRETGNYDAADAARQYGDEIETPQHRGAQMVIMLLRMDLP